jgi:hypothetical protein
MESGSQTTHSEQTMANIDPNTLPVKTLRILAHGMPARSQATKAELIAWIAKYMPERLTEDFEPHSSMYPNG